MIKDDFIEYLKYQKHYSDHTITSYNFDIDRYNDYLKKNNINYLKVEYDDISEFLNYLGECNLSNTTTSRTISALRSYYNFLMKKGIIKSNPFNLVSNKRKQRKLPNYLTFNEFDKMLKSSGKGILGIRNVSIMEMMVASGVRVSELVNIKMNDINYLDKSIRILGKGNKMRIVYYGDYAKEGLNNYLSVRKTLLNNNESDYLYLNNHGKKLTTKGVEEIIKKILFVSGIEKNVTPHVLRHTFATMMINEGANVKVVQELLGHSSLDTTSIYTHITNDRLRSVYLNAHPRARK